MTTNKNPAPRANAESRANHLPICASTNSTLADATPSLAAFYLARRFGLSILLAAFVARLAELGRALA